MKLNRRQFCEVSGKGAIGLAIARATAIGATPFLLAGCGITITDVMNWTQIGAGAISTVMTLLGGIAGFACAACIVAANVATTAINAIAGAITEWQNAPATDKATLWGKIHTALVAAFDQVTAFFNGINLTANPLVKTIISIASLVFSALSGFITKFFPTVALSLNQRQPKMGAEIIPFSPKEYKPNDFKKALNNILISGGHSELVTP